MRNNQFTAKTYALAAVLLLLRGVVFAETVANTDTSFYSKYPYIRFVGVDDATTMSDETFFAVAANISFGVARTSPAANDKFLAELKNDVLPRINADSLELAYMVVRGAASPDGSYEKNKVLGQRRAKWLFDFISGQLRFPVNEQKFRLDSEAEDYRTLCYLMRRAGDEDYGFVKAQCDSLLPSGDIAQLKTILRRAQHRQLWKRIDREYFQYLRTARIVLYFKKYDTELLKIEPMEAATIQQPTPELQPTVAQQLLPLVKTEAAKPVTPAPAPVEQLPAQERLRRQELLSLKTNLLFYGAYIPGYDRWCPIPNVALEYYPKKGHLTFGASFDMPWWRDYDAHKYFQLRNYQIEGRYYLKANRANEANRAYEANGANKANRPAYAGFYLQGYVNGGIFGICFDADRGWVGEGIGGGIGFGYVTPLSRKGHWRLEFGLQAGFFRCKYDPYQYENPVDPTYKDNLYYYKWTLNPSLFKKRQYRWNWIGPTRIGITLSYDLLYRRIQKKGVSFRAYEVNKTYEPQQERRTEP